MFSEKISDTRKLFLTASKVGSEFCIALVAVEIIKVVIQPFALCNTGDFEAVSVCLCTLQMRLSRKEQRKSRSRYRPRCVVSLYAGAKIQQEKRR